MGIADGALVALPATILFLFAQRGLAGGLTGGAKALAEIEYTGAITLEPFRRRGHLLSMPFAQWRPPSRDEDTDLRASASLLRGVLHWRGQNKKPPAADRSRT